MEIKKPCSITPRLLPGIKIDNDFVSISYDERTIGELDGRTRYQYWIDINNKEYTAHDLKSGCQGGTLQDGLTSLLILLIAAGEADRYFYRTGRESENLDLFPKHVREWASKYIDELSMIQLELNEKQLIIE